MIEEIKTRIDNLKVSIDSLYIQQNESLDVIVNSDKLHELRSSCKVLISMATGIAIENKLFSLDENVYKYLEKYITNENNKHKIKQWTIKTLLTHTTGYSKTHLTTTEINEKGLDKSNLIDYILNIDIENEPNIKYVYNNVEPFILSVLFKEKHNIDIEDYINENIFKKIDIAEYTWNRYGNYCPGCTGLYLYPKDFHKIGIILLNNGVYNGISLVPNDWISYMTTTQIDTPDMIKRERLFPKYGAGYFTFISRDGYVFRDGTNGQYIIINKAKGLIISIMASEKDVGKVTELFRDIY